MQPMLSDGEIAKRRCDYGCGRRLADGWVAKSTKKANTYICTHCDTRERNEMYGKTREITTRLLLDAHLDDARLHSERILKAEDARVDSLHRDEILRTMKACDELIGEFRRRIWMGHLCKRIYEARSGLSGGTRTFKMMALASAGRALITIQDAKKKGAPGGVFGGAMVTLIAADGDVASRLGVQGIAATKDEAIGLLWHATYEFPGMHEDKNVSIG